MTEHLAVAIHPKQFERHRPLPDLDATNTKRAQPGHDGSEVGDVQSDRAHLGFGKSRNSAMPDAQSLKTPLPSDAAQHVVLDSEMARFLRDGACRR